MKILFGFTAFGIIAILVFGATFGFITALEADVETEGGSRVILYITGVLAIAGVLFVIWGWRDMEKDPECQDPGFVLTAIVAFIIAPLVSTMACGVGFFGSFILLSVIHPNEVVSFAPFDSHSHDQLFIDPTVTFKAAGVIIGFYFLLGFVVQLISWIFVKKKD